MILEGSTTNFIMIKNNQMIIDEFIGRNHIKNSKKNNQLQISDKSSHRRHRKLPSDEYKITPRRDHCRKDQIITAMGDQQAHAAQADRQHVTQKVWCHEQKTAALDQHIQRHGRLPTDHLPISQGPAEVTQQADAGGVRPRLLQRPTRQHQAGGNGKRIVVFSGGEAKDLDGIYKEVTAIRDGGGNGSIIGRNTFQRPKEEALAMLDHIIKIYQNKA